MKETEKPNNFKYIVDAKFLPLLEKADNGCLESQAELCNIFGQGVGAKKNFDIVAHYDQIMFENTTDNRLKLAILWNRALYYKDDGNNGLMKEQFHTVIDFMQENMPMEEWDFELFALMEEFTQFD